MQVKENSEGEETFFQGAPGWRGSGGAKPAVPTGAGSVEWSQSVPRNPFPPSPFGEWAWGRCHGGIPGVAFLGFLLEAVVWRRGMVTLPVTNRIGWPRQRQRVQGRRIQ